MTNSVARSLGHSKTVDDGVFYTDMTSFRTDFKSLDVGMYQDWKQHAVTATWDRQMVNVKKKWTLKNDHQQDVVVQLDAYNSRMFPRGCKDGDMPEWQWFTLGWKKDYFGKDYSYGSA